MVFATAGLDDPVRGLALVAQVLQVNLHSIIVRLATMWPKPSLQLARLSSYPDIAYCL